MNIKIGKKSKITTLIENCEIDFNGNKEFTLIQTIVNGSKATFEVVLQEENQMLKDALEYHFNKNGLQTH